MLSDVITHTLFQVGGLPQAELNQLELQFLLLNNFDLVISSDEMQRYAETLFKYSDSHAVISENEYSDVSTPAPARPLQSMGAIDAYGGSVATEFTSDSRPNGTFHKNLSRFSGVSGKPVNSSNRPVPQSRGETVLTRMLCGPYSAARPLVAYTC